MLCVLRMFDFLIFFLLYWYICLSYMLTISAILDSQFFLLVHISRIKNLTVFSEVVMSLHTRCDQKKKKKTLFSNFESYVCSILSLFFFLVILVFLLYWYICLSYMLTISAILDFFFFLTVKKVSPVWLKKWINETIKFIHT